MDNNLSEAKAKVSFRNIKLMGIPAPIYAVILVISLALIYLPDAEGVAGGRLRDNFLGMFACISAVAILIAEIGDRIPVWNKYVGGGFTLLLFATSALSAYGLIPEIVQSEMNVFYNENPANFMEMQIVFLVIGSVLTINRKLLIKSLKGYFPMIIVGVLGAAIAGIAIGFILGHNPIEMMLHYIIPIMGAGIGTGAIPMQEMIASQTTLDAGEWFTKAVVNLSIANVLCIIVASVLNQIGLKKPNLTGKTLLRSDQIDEDVENEKEYTGPVETVDFFAAAVMATPHKDNKIRSAHYQIKGWDMS